MSGKDSQTPGDPPWCGSSHQGFAPSPRAIPRLDLVGLSSFLPEEVLFPEGLLYLGLSGNDQTLPASLSQLSLPSQRPFCAQALSQWDARSLPGSNDTAEKIVILWGRAAALEKEPPEISGSVQPLPGIGGEGLVVRGQ